MDSNDGGVWCTNSTGIALARCPVRLVKAVRRTWCSRAVHRVTISWIACSEYYTTRMCSRRIARASFVIASYPTLCSDVSTTLRVLHAIIARTRLRAIVTARMAFLCEIEKYAECRANVGAQGWVTCDDKRRAGNSATAHPGCIIFRTGDPTYCHAMYCTGASGSSYSFDQANWAPGQCNSGTISTSDPAIIGIHCFWLCNTLNKTVPFCFYLGVISVRFWMARQVMYVWGYEW
jgi:hypothetical protein